MQYRGMIKWTQMMIPTHIEMLNSYISETKKEPKPTLDEHMWEEIAWTIEDSMNNQYSIKLYHWNAGMIEIEEGDVLKVNTQAGTLTLVEESQTRKDIKLKNIVKVS